ncbi:MAG: MFS transporter [Oscillospiraceae bacterium]|nr:MFS transporter [Oscillospiraceae bacterium]
MKNNGATFFSADYFCLIVVAFGSSIVNHFFFSSLSLFAESITGSATYAGILSMAYSVTALVLRPVAGIVSDRVGRVKMIIAGATLSTVSCLLYGTTRSIWLLLIIRAVHGVGFSISTTSAGAAVPDISPKEKMAQAVGIFGLNSTVAQALGPVIALAIIGNGETDKFNILFFVAAAFCCASLISGSLVGYERKRKKEGPPVKTAADIQKSGDAAGKTIFGFEIPVFGPSLVMMLYFLSLTSVLAFLTLFAKNRGLQVEHLGWFFFITSGGMLVTRPLFGKTMDKRGADIIVIPGLIVTVFCLAAIPFARSLGALMLIAVPYGVASGAVIPSVNAIMFKRCSADRRGSASAAYFASVDLGITLGAPIMGWLADNAGFEQMYIISAVIIFACYLLYVFFFSDKRYERKIAGAK